MQFEIIEILLLMLTMIQDELQQLDDLCTGFLIEIVVHAFCHFYLYQNKVHTVQQRETEENNKK